MKGVHIFGCSAIQSFRPSHSQECGDGDMFEDYVSLIGTGEGFGEIKITFAIN